MLSPVYWLAACTNHSTLFQQVSSSHSGITFNNKITETDSINPLNVVNIYNGGGVGIGDFNNDGLQDIYFTGNMVSGKLYLNKGDFKFDDITEKSNTTGEGRWARGVSVIDINNDGLMDLYICNTIYKDSLKRRNILYVNQGIDKEGIPHFKDMAAEYGLDIHVQSTMANFFDYDNDGDLDMYLVVNEASYGNNTSVFLKRNQPGTQPSLGRLFKNDMHPGDKYPVFHDVSAAAGIQFEGYGHAATICDINNDGWKDIYVSDDFLSSNLLYINNHDGTFTNKTQEYFKHTSYNAMGQDVVDMNNDGLPEVIELDMSPEDNYRKKMILGTGSYLTYQNFDKYNYQYQYVRNTLQLNQGPQVKQSDSLGSPVFSEVAFMSGIAQTDWSWSPLVTDLDNDGFRDLIITNGFPRDVSDHDFIAYRQKANALVSTNDMLKEIPQVKLHNYGYKNNGDLTFSDQTKAWGLNIPTFSNGIAYADFDNDGAMDMVISNINDEALLYRNTQRQTDTASSHFLNIKFKGGQQNINGIGAVASIFYDHGKQQVYENNPYRGYLSSMQGISHFGLGNISQVDSVVIKWNNGFKQTLQNVKADQVIEANIANAKEENSWSLPALAPNTMFTEVTAAAGISYKHFDIDFIDFNLQTTLPHKLSEYCPAIAATDVDGNGLDDMIVGGNSSVPAQVFLQQANGKFVKRDFFKGAASSSVQNSDAGILIFDANGDGKPDVYMASGGYKYDAESESYQDKLYLNDGKGNFTLATNALPQNFTSKQCVKAFDYNGDGKLDLFVSGRVMPKSYPKPVSSFIFRNDSQNGVVKFTDVTKEVAPALNNIGMVCDALFTDFDNDTKPDLLLAGEWMPVTFLKNVNGKFVDATRASGVADKTGWWNSIVAGDFRHTGRTDYIIGNVGQNSLFQASDKFPVSIIAKDFDNNGSFVPITSLYLPDEKGELKNFPAIGRDDIVERIPTMKKRFNHYNVFAKSTLEQIISPELAKGALHMQANYLKSCYLRNEGNGKFTMIPLPAAAQVSAVNGMVADDFDGDGNLDVLLCGNDYGTEVSIGRYDALNGLLLKGDGNGSFSALTILQSGIYIPGNAKGLVKLRSSNGRYLIAATQNRGPLKLFELKQSTRNITINPADVRALITYNNGKTQKEEFYYGSSFLSQSARFVKLSNKMKSLSITNSQGISRTIDISAGPQK